MQVRLRVERGETIRRLKPVEGDPRREPPGQRLHPPAQRVLADDVEVDVEAAIDEARKGGEQRDVVLDVADAGDPKQPPRRAVEAGRERKDVRVDAGRDDGDRGEGEVVGDLPSHERRRDGDPRRLTKHRRNRPSVEPAPLQAVADVVDRGQLAALERGHQRDAKAPRDRRGDDRGHALIRVQHIERTVRVEEGRQAPALRRSAKTRRPAHASDIMDCGAEQRIAAGFGIIMQGEHVHVVAARQPLDQPEQARRDPLAARTIDAAGHDQSDAHARQASHEGEW